MRLVIDTNVIVAGLAYPSGPPGRIVAAWQGGTLEVVLSPWILTESQRVLPRLVLFKLMRSDDLTDLIGSLALASEVIIPDLEALTLAAAADVRDLMDEPVLALLLASGAELLITGDKDLLALADRFAIVTPAAFCARHAP